MSENRSLYGIVGYPVTYSLSPLMHNAAFEALGVDAAYKLFPLKEDELDEFFEELKEEGSPIFGLNVTVPYKETALKHLDALTPFAKKVGAVNTIVIDNERKLTGYNTDAPGFLSHLAELGFPTKDRHVAIIGAGGVARAIVAAFCLIDEKPASVRIFDVAGAKTRQLMEDLRQRMDLSIVEAVETPEGLGIETADLLINATPIGMKADDPCLVDPEMLHGGLDVYDVIYKPARTRLLRDAHAKGARVTNGLGMLFYQGVLAFQHWADMELDGDVKKIMRDQLEKGVHD